MLETFTLPGSSEIIRLFRVSPQLDQADLRLELSLLDVLSSTRTGREHGAEAHETMRGRMSVPFVLVREKAESLCEILGQLTHSRVAIPIWTVKTTVAGAANAVLTADWLLNFDETGYAFRLAEQVTDFRYQYVCPCVIGYLDGKPQLQNETDQICTVTVTIKEDSPYELHLRPNDTGFTFTNDWPDDLRPDWSANVTGVDDIIDLIDVDLGRERPVEGDEAPPKWWQEANFQLNTPEKIRKMLSWWYNRKGRVYKYNTPMWFKPGEDTTVTPHSTVARFAANTLVLNFKTTGYAETKIRMAQLPWEHLQMPNAGGVWRMPVYLLEFRYKVPGEVSWYFTNFERDLQEDGNDDAPLWKSYGSFKVTRPKQQMGIGKEVWELSCYRPVSGKAEDNPLMLTVPNNLEGELECRIYEVDPKDVAAATLEFVGKVIPDKTNGRRIDFKVGSFTTLLDRKVPSFRIQRQCNYQIFSRLCGVSESSWRIAATITDKNGSTLTVNTTGGRSLSGGRLYGGNGLNYEQRPIVGQSSNRLDIMKPLRNLDVGDTVYLLPGCSGTETDCRAYDNFARFGGHLHVPVDNNPSITPIQGQVQTAKK